MIVVKSIKEMFEKLRIACLVLVAFATLLVTSTSPALADNYEIKMGSDAGQLVFEPANLVVKPGDTVTWVNNKMAPHNVIFDERIIPGDKALADQISHNQLTFAPGESYSTTFTAHMPTGEYKYYCAPHRGAGMAGQIKLEG